MPTHRPARPDGPRALRRDGALADLRPPLAHRPASARRRGTSTRSWATTTIPNSPTRRGCPPTASPPTSTPETRARNLAEHLDRIDNTVQYSWLLEIARTFHGFPHDRITPRDDRRPVRPGRPRPATAPAWDREVWNKTKLEAVFLTNEFDDPLEGWDTRAVRPLPADRRPRPEAARADDPRAAPTRDRASTCRTTRRSARRSASSSSSSSNAGRGPARSACRPTSPRPRPSPKRAVTPIRRALHQMDLRPDEHDEIRRVVFWTLAEFCAEFRLPFDLMIGPIRNVYPAGVAGGPRPVRPPGQPARLPRAVQPLRRRDLPGLDPLARRRGRAGGLLLDLPERGARWGTGGTRTSRRSSPPTCGRGSRRCRRSKLVGYYSDAYKLEFVLPEVQHVPPDPGRDAGRGRDPGPGLVGRPRPRPGAARAPGESEADLRPDRPPVVAAI